MLLKFSHFCLVVMAVAIILSITGCNAFESFDHAARDSDHSALESEARLILNAGEYTQALEIYQRIIEEGTTSDAVLRGRAYSWAGLAGFNMLAALDRLQNSLLPADSPAIVFNASAMITDSAKLKKAVDDLNRLMQPTKDDLLLRSMLVSFLACHKLLEKYDTNYSGRLDAPDQIGFNTKDDKTMAWPDLYAMLTAENAEYSLEKAFVDMANALNGRGTDWILITPIAGRRISGLYTSANRNMILAIGNFAHVLQTANGWYDISETNFSQTILGLDGVQ